MSLTQCSPLGSWSSWEWEPVKTATSSFALEVVHGDHVVAARHDEFVGGGGSGGGNRAPDPATSGAASPSYGCRRRRPVRMRPSPGDVDVVDARDLSDGGDDGAAVPVVDPYHAAVRAAGHDEVLSCNILSNDIFTLMHSISHSPRYWAHVR